MVLLIMISVFILLMICVSAFFSRFVKTGEDFYLGGRRMPWWVLGPTIAAGLFGGTSMLVVAGNAMTDGLSAIWILAIPSWIGAFVSAIFFARKVRSLPGVASLPDLIELRYDKVSRNVFMIVTVLFYIAFTTSQLLAIGKFVFGFSGISVITGMGIALIVVLIYATVSGFLGVVITDTIMAAILFVGLVILAFSSLSWGNGWSNISETITSTTPDFFNLFSTSIHPLLAIVYVAAFGLALVPQQDIFQRYASAKDEKNALFGGLFALVIFIPLYILPMIAGISGKVWLPLQTSETVPVDQFVAWTAKNMFSPFLSAFLFVAIVAAIMSTLSTTINSGALNITKDVYQQYVNKNASPKQVITISRLATILMGLLAFIFATTFDVILDALYLAFNVAFAGMFVPVIGAFYWKRATARGATWSALAGTIFVLFDFILLKVGKPIPWPDSAYGLVTAFLLSLAAFVIGSLTSVRPTDEKTKYFFKQKSSNDSVEIDE
ncbi:sodium:solute symporter family protein [Sporosarcina aquimarina]|uniref:sodium:solute symporter family protein n=1 Tax=Sporosarcina aquimarina TaxID=114975 RepID=UPI001C8D79DB|nr:sodium:solute symporter family protein [Sporosarcina aquimarina]MBY0221617.1 sodium:solute symporter family protein [Sporosarcina aquimarina]